MQCTLTLNSDERYCVTRFSHIGLATKKKAELTGAGNVANDAECLQGFVPDQSPHDRLTIAYKNRKAVENGFHLLSKFGTRREVITSRVAQPCRLL